MSDTYLTNFLFIHVMKTGGTSLADIIAKNFANNELYPEASLSTSADTAAHIEAYTYLPRLVREVNAAGRSFRLVRAHVPYAVRSLLERNFTAITILRHPVDRTLSYLNHCKKYHVEHRDKSLEDIYADEWFYRSFIENYQTKIFSMSAAESLAQTRLGDQTPLLPPREAFEQGKPMPADARRLHESGGARFALELFSSPTGVIPTDNRRLEIAKANLDEIELVGTTENYGYFLERLKETFGWDIPQTPKKNAGIERAVSQGFREKIASDNQLDLDLFNYAQQLGGKSWKMHR